MMHLLNDRFSSRSTLSYMNCFIDTGNTEPEVRNDYLDIIRPRFTHVTSTFDRMSVTGSNHYVYHGTILNIFNAMR